MKQKSTSDGLSTANKTPVVGFGRAAATAATTAATAAATTATTAGEATAATAEAAAIVLSFRLFARNTLVVLKIDSGI